MDLLTIYFSLGGSYLSYCTEFSRDLLDERELQGWEGRILHKFDQKCDALAKLAAYKRALVLSAARIYAHLSDK